MKCGTYNRIGEYGNMRNLCTCCFRLSDKRIRPPCRDVDCIFPFSMFSFRFIPSTRDPVDERSAEDSDVRCSRLARWGSRAAISSRKSTIRPFQCEYKYAFGLVESMVTAGSEPEDTRQ